jgi:hypothetical protein
MRLDQQGWSAVAAASRAVSERALTEREACIEVWARTGGLPRDVVRAVRVGVRLLERRARGSRASAGLERDIRRVVRSDARA